MSTRAQETPKSAVILATYEQGCSMEIKASGLGIALGGIERGLRDLGEAASEIAGAVKEETEIAGLANSLVDVIEAQRQIEASANVVRRIDETLGTLIDTFV